MKKSMKILIKFPIQLLATEVSYCFQSQILNFFIINLLKSIIGKTIIRVKTHAYHQFSHTVNELLKMGIEPQNPFKM